MINAARVSTAAGSFRIPFEEWFSNDLLLAATLLDPTQANAYFSPQGGSQADAAAAKTLLDRAWTAISTIGSALSDKARAPAAGSDTDEDAGAGDPAPAYVGLLGLLGDGAAGDA